MTRWSAISWVDEIKHRYIHGGDEKFDERRREALDMAIAALREQEERNKGCSACDGGFGDNTMVFYAGGYKHCPMCGRRLEEDNE